MDAVLTVGSVRAADGRPDEREQFGLEARLLALGQREQGSAEEDCETVDGGPDRVLDVRASRCGKDSGRDQIVEGGPQKREGVWLVARLTWSMLVGGRERGVEEAWF